MYSVGIALALHREFWCAKQADYHASSLVVGRINGFRLGHKAGHRLSLFILDTEPASKHPWLRTKKPCVLRCIRKISMLSSYSFHLGIFLAQRYEPRGKWKHLSKQGEFWNAR
jgi:hypothetical protein